MSDAASVNREFYGALPPGQLDYWRLMAAPRFRVATFARLIAEAPGTSLVDLGCGSGLLLGEIARRHPSLALAGIDLSAPQIEANRASSPAIDWHVADLGSEALPAALVGRFDTVVASEIIEHLDQPGRLLDRARELARPGGRLLLSTQSGPRRETERRVGHVRHFGADEIEALLAAHGWRPLRVWNAGFPFHDLSKWWANRDPVASMDRFAAKRYGVRERLVCAALRLAFRFNSNRRGAQLFAVAKRDA